MIYLRKNSGVLLGIDKLLSVGIGLYHVDVVSAVFV